MARLKLVELLSWTGGSLLATAASTEIVFSGISSDTRTIEPGSLFLALRGQNHDGHDYLGQAVAAGASGLLIEDRAAMDRLPGTDRLTVILVGDTLKALQEIAAGYRQTLPACVIGISGSVGKTSTRQMISACLQPTLRVHQTAGNLNNEIGLPQTLLQTQMEHQAAVLEMGMRGPGEISLLSRIAQPDVAVLTGIGYAHIGRLGSQAAILAAKTEIVEGLRPGGLLILNGDDPLLLAWGQRQAALAQHQSDGFRMAWTTSSDALAAELADKSAFTLSSSDLQTSADGSGFTASLHIRGCILEQVSVKLPFPGGHHVQNALMGLAVAHELDVPLESAALGAANCRNTGNRQRIIEAGGLLIMDDSYNASPESMLAALQTLAGLAAGRRLVAALGCMLELGDFAESAHFNLGRQAAGQGFARLLVTGPQAACITAGAHATNPGLLVSEYPDNLSLAAALVPELKAGDCLLVKGSRGFAMEKVTEAVLNFLSEMEKSKC